ncbi:hypothetical protein ACFYOV_09665 [Streptomyces sp. NPDC005931]
MLTTESDAPVAGNQDSATVGLGGPLLFPDRMEEAVRAPRED